MLLFLAWHLVAMKQLNICSLPVDVSHVLDQSAGLPSDFEVSPQKLDVVLGPVIFHTPAHQSGLHLWINCTHS